MRLDISFTPILFAAVAVTRANGFSQGTRWVGARRHIQSSSSLGMVQNRGLERRREGATPTGSWTLFVTYLFDNFVENAILTNSHLFLTEGGMTIYLKAGPDGTSVGDCPFAQFVRMVLEEKGLEYTVKPCVQETKPSWLVEFYDGKMPALRHRKECYVESDVIAEYLDFFFRDPPLKSLDRDAMEAAEEATAGLFPAIAQYLKHTPDGDDVDEEKKENLEAALSKLETHLQEAGGPLMTGESMTLVDCSLAPKLFHMQTGIESFKNDAINVQSQFPAVGAYMDAVFARDSFQNTSCPKETVTWGWGNARS